MTSELKRSLSIASLNTLKHSDIKLDKIDSKKLKRLKVIKHKVNKLDKTVEFLRKRKIATIEAYNIFRTAEILVTMKHSKTIN